MPLLRRYAACRRRHICTLRFFASYDDISSLSLILMLPPP